MGVKALVRVPSHVNVVAGLLLGRFGGSKPAVSTTTGNGALPHAAQALSPPEPAPMEMELTEFAPPSGIPPDSAHLVSGSSALSPLDGPRTSQVTAALALQEKAGTRQVGTTSSVSPAGLHLQGVGILEETGTCVSVTVSSPPSSLDPSSGDVARPNSMPARAAHNSPDAQLRVRESALQEGGVMGGRLLPGASQQRSPAGAGKSAMTQTPDGSSAGAPPQGDRGSSEVPTVGQRAATTTPVTTTKVSTSTTAASLLHTVRFADETVAGPHAPDQQPSGTKLVENGLSEELPETGPSSHSSAEAAEDDGEYFRLLEGIRRTRSETLATRSGTSAPVSRSLAEEASSGGTAPSSHSASERVADLAHPNSSASSSFSPREFSAADSFSDQMSEGMREGSPASAHGIPGDVTQSTAVVPAGPGTVVLTSPASSFEGPARVVSYQGESPATPIKMLVPAQRQEQEKGSAFMEPAGAPSVNQGGALAGAVGAILLGTGPAASLGQTATAREAGLATVGLGEPRSNVARVAQLSRISSDTEGATPFPMHVCKPTFVAYLSSFRESCTSFLDALCCPVLLCVFPPNVICLSRLAWSDIGRLRSLYPRLCRLRCAYPMHAGRPLMVLDLDTVFLVEDWVQCYQAVRQTL